MWVQTPTYAATIIPLFGVEFFRRFRQTDGMNERIARVRIVLDDIEPEIWRRVEVPLDFSPKGLHDVIQGAMGWLDYHLYEFAVGDKIYGLPDREGDDVRKIRQARLAKLAPLVDQGIRTFSYLYDMGDSWEHTITIESIDNADPKYGYPRFVDDARRGPPEDVGGVPGYYEFIKAVTRPKHREHKRMLEWYGRAYDPDDIDAMMVRYRIGDIAKRRHAGKLAYQKRASR
jgi:hypothetical protein